MFLNQILNNVKVIQAVNPPELVEIKNITLDSREVGKNSIFVAVRGFKMDGHNFIPQAVSKGAAAVVMEYDDPEISMLLQSNKVAKILVSNSRQALAQMSAALFKNPSSKINLIGITGTKGKTTTSYYIKNIFDEAERKSGLIGTNKNIIGDVESKSSLTTPESYIINDLLNQMVSMECSDCVMEVSSHALQLSRVDNLEFNIGIFTNITSDHLDFHSNFDNYLNSKKIFFDILDQDSTIVFNGDDSNSKYLLSDCMAKQLSYSVRDDSDLTIKNISYNLEGTSFSLDFNNEIYEVQTKLIGPFNAYNSTAAIGAALCSNLSIEDAIKGIYTTPQVPGRFEVIGKQNKKVIIDYSHTADSLQKALEAIKHINSKERHVVTVFGCGGDRDRTKRPVMGRIAELASDHVILTSDNPRTEDPFSIIKEIEAGMSSNNYEVIEDREKAIKTAIENSDEDAVILIAGKGHENYQEINHVRSFFSDKETAEKYL
ncbi:MAG: UDP-N-acetylmuramoyl-L-alanyl-D-glutamate--2,6-diaminopimelate ligase [Melioribacteraceae bacterium]|nr:UDP-N-acetylmuramoyl-L-alanyl-D-glutamate--2,6-diaminopimelate ligase [Melioribacteraceae bacterium]